MEISKILQADILDILFEGKNKEYGAYDLRKTYNRRLLKAIVIMGAVLVMLFSGYFLSGLTAGPKKEAPRIADVDISSLKEEKVKEILPPPPKVEPPKMQMIKTTPPRIVKDNEVKPDDVPPEQDKIEDSKIGTVNQDGMKDDGITAPPASDGGKGILQAPKKDETDYDQTFVKVEVESAYPGGTPAWQRYMNKSLRYPDEAINLELQGTVMVQFIVDKEGNVSDVEAVDGPAQGGLREEAIRVIKKSGKWTPAIQNGRQVKSYKRQPITFKMGAGE